MRHNRTFEIGVMGKLVSLWLLFISFQCWNLTTGFFLLLLNIKSEPGGVLHYAIAAHEDVWGCLM